MMIRRSNTASRAPAWPRAAARFIAARRGAALVEFAFVSPGLLLALLGATEFGYLLWNRHSLEFAVEESARMVLTKQTITDAEITADVKSRIINIDANAVAPSVVRETIGATTFVEINVSYTYNFMFGGYFGLGPIQLSTKSRVPLRQND